VAVECCVSLGSSLRSKAGVLLWRKKGGNLITTTIRSCMMAAT
jgi:hypothetical protein